MKLSRRQLAAAVTAAAALSAESAPVEPNAQDDLAAAKQQIADAASALAKIDYPQSTEPAVHFRA